MRHEAYKGNGQWSRSPFPVGDVPWGVAGRREFLTVQELPLKGLVRRETGHQDARLGNAIVWGISTN
jgi:hypothetical protein